MSRLELDRPRKLEGRLAKLLPANGVVLVRWLLERAKDKAYTVLGTESRW
jgi:hypothetical protein